MRSTLATPIRSAMSAKAAPVAGRQAAFAVGLQQRYYQTLPSAPTNQVAIRRGGRASVSGVVATVFGATGQLGRYVVNRLGQIGSQVIVPYRGDGQNTRHLRLMGDLGQVVPVPCSTYDADSVKEAVSRSNVVINLIGQQFETRNYDFHDVHVKIPHRLAKISKEAGVEKFIQMSCLGADPSRKSAWVRSKWEGEQAIRDIYDDATIMRCATIFGPEDNFINRHSNMIRFSPTTPLVGDGQQQIQPVFVVDVARAIVNSLSDPEAPGTTYHLAGPDVFTYEQIVEEIYDAMYEPKQIVKVPATLAKLYGGVLQHMPEQWRGLSPDLVDYMNEDYVLEKKRGQSAPKQLHDLGINSTSLRKVFRGIMEQNIGIRGPELDDRATPLRTE